MLIRPAIIGLMLILILAGTSNTQVATSNAVAGIDDAWKAEVIDSVLTIIDKNYVFPDMAKNMVKHIREQQKKKVYKDIPDGFAFGDKLTDDLREICHDLHLGVRYTPEITAAYFAPDSLLSDEEKKRRDEEELRNLRFNNYAFEKLEILEGNVGYLKLNGFIPAELGGATAVAAMNFLANSEAIIIDLRDNGGGDPTMIQLISSYFFKEPTHLNNFYYRPADSIQQFWTQSHVQGPRLTDVGLFILTSNYTFSAAEEFTYNMKNLKRATIVGETTGGGAHPVDDFGLPALKITVRVPIGRAVNPITGTNWEGAGITPHIEVPRDQALDRAHLEALKKIRDRISDEDVKNRYTWVIETKETLANPHTISPDLMAKYAGAYGPRIITLEDGELFYQRVDRPKYKMIPMSDDTFIFEDIPYFRIQIVTDDMGNVTEVIGQYDTGRIDRTPRDPGP